MRVRMLLLGLISSRIARECMDINGTPKKECQLSSYAHVHLRLTVEAGALA
jgi:hypothetical protein